MCGIMGYTGVKAATPIIIKGLERLEYRGYDSAGIGVIENGDILAYKVCGSPGGLSDAIPENTKAFIGIGHTRWATHGEPTVENAHPHTSENGLFTVVHNGIIENYLLLKEQLLKEGYSFKSQTDTEVIAQLLQKEYDSDVKSTLNRVLPLLQGSYALGILCKDYPDTIFCAKNSSPLFAGLDRDSGYIASDISALPESLDKIYKIGDREIGILTKDELRVFDIDGCRIRKTEIKVRETTAVEGKGEYSHYMLKEIFEQPFAVKNTIDSIIIDGKIKLNMLKMTKEKLKRISKIEFVACGSAYHAGLVGAYAARKMLGIPAESYIASEYRYFSPATDENTLVVFISQSGETADTLAALREAKSKKAKIVSIVNAPLSTIAQESDSVIFTKAGREVAVATTKAFSAQLTVIYLLITRIAFSCGKIQKPQYLEFMQEIKNLPDKIGEILKNHKQYRDVAKELKDAPYTCFIGRGMDFCAATEGALKLKEVSYTHCEAYAAGELKHGTISLIEKGTPVIAVASSDSLKTKTISNIKECKARGAKIICIGNDEGYSPDADDMLIKIPSAYELFQTILSVIPMQLIAYYTALEKGCSIDKPKNLAKSVTVE